MDEYSKLVRSEVGVRLEEMRFIGGINVTNPQLQCTFTLHRGHCTNPAITLTETIAWNTRICFLWSCSIPEHAMRVENCWAGSEHNPVFLLTPQGCSSETAMISSPTYDRDMRRASSVGWLAVRQVGVEYIRLGCNIRLCHLCEENCSLITVSKHFSIIKQMTKRSLFRTVRVPCFNHCGSEQQQSHAWIGELCKPMTINVR
uniref:ZP domain-containing protein n=1 Tax=Parascaris equorum TaxID=6256 RepID=A0A914S4F3_PAREQ